MRGDGQIGFAPGALDGMLAHGALEYFHELDDDEDFADWCQKISGTVESRHIADEPFDESQYVSQVLSALRQFIASPSQESALVLYNLPVCNSAMTAIDRILDAVDNNMTLPMAHVVEVGRWLAMEAADREVVKFGIALLCLSHSTAFRELFLTLGRHEEFTTYAAAALRDTEAEPDRLLWELAKSLCGWGRVALVEQLTDTHDPDIKRWLLTDGFENHVHNDEVVLVCAKTGGLYTELLEPEIDPELFHGIGSILCHLMRPNYNFGIITEYPDAVDAITLYMKLVLTRELDIDGIAFVSSMRHFLQQRVNTLDPSLGWQTRRPELMDLVTAIQTRPEWAQIIHEGLTSEDEWLRRRVENLRYMISADS